MPEYIGTKLKDDIKISELYSVHYFEYSKNFRFDGEKHNFWEIVYVDKGEIIAVEENNEYLLTHGKMIFHKPNVWHELKANGETAPNLIIISFSSNSQAMDFFENKTITLGQSQKNLLSKIIIEYKNSFITELDNPNTTELLRRPVQRLKGAEQLIKLYITELLILLMRDNDYDQHKTFTGKHIDSNIETVTNIMNANLFGKLSLKSISKQSGMSVASISAMFSKYFNMGVMEYFFSMKIEAAKKYIREDNYNITQISEILGYSSVHYFSRQFKKTTGMSPTQYAISVKALSEME